MATRAAAVQTPGETTTPAQADTPATGAVPGGATVEELQAALAAQAAQMQQLMGMVANLQANQRAVPAQAAADALPDVADLDLDEINRGSTAVLTRQGWIVPPNFGADPVQLAEEQARRDERAALMKLAEVAAQKA